MAYGSTLTNRTPPTVSVTTGPTFATTINAMLNEIVGILEAKPAAAELNINAALEFNNNEATEVKSVALQTKASAPSGVRRIYTKTSDGELHYIDDGGTDVQITNNGNLNASGIGGIGGDYGGANPATASFTESSSTYTLLESGTVASAGLRAKLDTGDIVLKRAAESAP